MSSENGWHSIYIILILRGKLGSAPRAVGMQLRTPLKHIHGLSHQIYLALNLTFKEY
jgi:hypothetical protein